MTFIDVTGRGKFLVNLDQVSRINPEALGEYGHITFVYANGDEDTFKVSPGRLSVLLDALLEAQVA